MEKEIQLTFIVTKNCHNHCMYCTQKHKNENMDLYMFTSKLFLTFDKFSTDPLYKKFNKIKLNIDLFGGEPLLNPEINDIISTSNYVKEKLNNKECNNFENIEINKITLFSSIDLVTKDVVEFLNNNNIYLSISYDGVYNYKRNGFFLQQDLENFIKIFKNNKKLLKYFKEKVTVKFSVGGSFEDLNYFHTNLQLFNHYFNHSEFYLLREPEYYTEEVLTSLSFELNKIKDDGIFKFSGFNKIKNNIINKKGLEKFGCEGGLYRFTFTPNENFLACGINNEFESKESNDVPGKEFMEEYCKDCDIKDYCEKECSRVLKNYPPITNGFCRAQRLIYNTVKGEIQDEKNERYK